MNLNVEHWQVWDPAFNQEEAWPAREFPEATLHYMKEAGCMVTAIATMLRVYDIEKRSDPEEFNPWIFCRELKQRNAFDRTADLTMEALQDIYPVIYLGDVDYSREKLVECLSAGEMCLVQVEGVHDCYHFVVPVRAGEEDVEIIDSGWDRPYLSQFTHHYKICRFMSTAKGENACGKE